MTPDQLPASARTKLANIAGVADDARDAVASASCRISDIQKALAYSETPLEDAPNLEHELTRLKAVCEQASRRQRANASLAANIGNWLTAQRGKGFEVLDHTTKPQPGESVTEAIARFRREIERTKAVLRNVEIAPAPKSDLKLMAQRYVEKLAADGAPKVSADFGSLDVKFGHPQAFGFSRHDAAAMLAWLHPDAMLARLVEAIEALPDDPNAMPADEKHQRLEDGRGGLLQLERSEEALILLAAVEGIEVARRPDADPRAVLGIAEKRRKIAKAA
jgi:hypothetical protein